MPWLSLRQLQWLSLGTWHVLVLLVLAAIERGHLETRMRLHLSWNGSPSSSSPKLHASRLVQSDSEGFTRDTALFSLACLPYVALQGSSLPLTLSPSRSHSHWRRGERENEAFQWSVTCTRPIMASSWDEKAASCQRSGWKSNFEPSKSCIWVVN